MKLLVPILLFMVATALARKNKKGKGGKGKGGKKGKNNKKDKNVPISTSNIVAGQVSSAPVQDDFLDEHYNLCAENYVEEFENQYQINEVVGLVKCLAKLSHSRMKDIKSNPKGRGCFKAKSMPYSNNVLKCAQDAGRNLNICNTSKKHLRYYQEVVDVVKRDLYSYQYSYRSWINANEATPKPEISEFLQGFFCLRRYVNGLFDGSREIKKLWKDPSATLVMQNQIVNSCFGEKTFLPLGKTNESDRVKIVWHVKINKAIKYLMATNCRLDFLDTEFCNNPVTKDFNFDPTAVETPANYPMYMNDFGECQAFTCSCPHGDPVTPYTINPYVSNNDHDQKFCNYNGEKACFSGFCQEGWIGKNCDIKAECFCENGQVGECRAHGFPSCARCDNGYALITTSSGDADPNGDFWNRAVTHCVFNV